jgi:transposase-like protein
MTVIGDSPRDTAKLMEKFGNEEETKAWEKENSLISLDGKCPKCGARMVLCKDISCNHGRLRCFGCAISMVPTKKTTLFRLKLRMGMLTKVLLCFWIGVKANQCEFLTAVSKPTILKLYSRARGCLAATEYFKRRQLGGINRIVEVDEAIVQRRKYHRGKRKPQVWIVGLAERAEEKGERCKLVMHAVKNRTSDVLLPIIDNYCRAGSTILTDKWKSYHGIKNIVGKIFQLFTVCHKTHFVDPISGAYTNTIEGMWSKFRRFLPSQGMKTRFLYDYIWAFLFKHNSRCNFVEFLSLYVNF